MVHRNALATSTSGPCPNRAHFPQSRAHSGPVRDQKSLLFSESVYLSDRPLLPWHGRGREFESHQVHQTSQTVSRIERCMTGPVTSHLTLITEAVARRPSQHF